MSSEQRARTSLAFDAAYSAGVGTTLIALAKPVGEKLGLPAAVVMTVGAGTIGWAAFVARSATRPSWRPAVAGVAAANVAATAALVTIAVKQPKVGAKVLVGITALEVAGFATSQILALVGEDPDSVPA